MSEPTVQEVMAVQGTRLSETPPWMSYSKEMDEKLDPKLEDEIDQYAQTRHEGSSAQNDEELCRQREINAGIAKEYQFLNPLEYADEGPRIGRVMHSDEFIGKLRGACQVKCWYRDHPQPDKITLVISDFAAMAEPKVGCWVQNGYMPEFSFVRFDEHGVPLNERRRGWRTCLLQLILKGVVTEDAANKVFGRAYGPASERYNSTLREWRNRRVEAI